MNLGSYNHYASLQLNKIHRGLLKPRIHVRNQEKKYLSFLENNDLVLVLTGFLKMWPCLRKALMAEVTKACALVLTGKKPRKLMTVS